VAAVSLLTELDTFGRHRAAATRTPPADDHHLFRGPRRPQILPSPYKPAPTAS